MNSNYRNNFTCLEQQLKWAEVIMNYLLKIKVKFSPLLYISLYQLAVV